MSDTTAMDAKIRAKDADNQRKQLESKFEIFTREWLKKNCTTIHRGFADLYPYQELCAQIHQRFLVDHKGKGKTQEAMKKDQYEKLVKNQLTAFITDFTKASVKHPKEAKTQFPYVDFVNAILGSFDVAIRVDE